MNSFLDRERLDKTEILRYMGGHIATEESSGKEVQ